MKKVVFLLFIFIYLLFPSASFALTQIDVEGNAIAWANAASTTENLGTTMASGDVNGDGIDDLLIANSGFDCTTVLGCSSDRENTGRVYLVYGSSNTASSPFTDETLSNAVAFTGVSASHNAGSSVAIFDINNDNYDDIFIGRTGSGTNGAVYLIYGQASTLSSITLNDSSVKAFTGQTGAGYVGDSPIVGGYINNDAYKDIVVGAQLYGSTPPYGDGAVYIKYGQSAQFSSGSFDSFDVKINGANDGSEFNPPEYTGSAIAIGNLNNDSFDDIIIGAYGTDVSSNTDAGKVHIIYGGASLASTINLSGSTDIEITGAATYDETGKGIGTSDLNDDGYDDIIIGSPGDDTAADSAGAVGLIYGQSATLSDGSLSSYVKITGPRSFGATGFNIAGGHDLNNDGYEDVVIGTPTAATAIGGQAHILFGSTSQETSGTLSDKADILLNSLVGNHQNNFGSSFALGDFNGDGSPQFSDIAIGAPSTGPNKGASYVFFQRFDSDDDGYDADAEHVLFSETDCDDTNIAIYTNYTFYQDTDGDTSGTTTTQTLCQGSSPSAPTGYRTSVINTTDCNDSDAAVYANQTYYLDADGDTIGTGATENICSATPSTGYRVSVSGGSDCNDSDAAVSANQTYYLDADGDGLGSDTTIAECVATAPAGYVTNSNDTDDAIINNGVEISGDGIDNDGDGSKDEVNTVAANGAHPGYKNLSITSGDDYKNAIQSVSAQTNGKVRVTFKDGSIYDYKIFTSNTSKKTLYKIVKSTGRIFAVSDNGKQIRIVNLFTGDILSTKTGIKSRKKFSKHHLIMQDIRNDGNLELLVTSWDKKNTAYLTLTRLTKTNTLKTQARKEISQITPDIKKTKINGSTIEIRNSKRKILKRFIVTNLYEFKNPK